MKRIFFMSLLAISQGFCSSSDKCWCSTEITSDFTDLKSTISSALTQQKTALSQLKSSIESAIAKIESQNDKLDKEINLVKDEAVRDYGLVFYLQQKNQLR